jgi:hypothetical protein
VRYFEDFAFAEPMFRDKAREKCAVNAAGNIVARWN